MSFGRSGLEKTKPVALHVQ